MRKLSKILSSNAKKAHFDRVSSNIEEQAQNLIVVVNIRPSHISQSFGKVCSGYTRKQMSSRAFVSKLK